MSIFRKFSRKENVTTNRKLFKDTMLKVGSSLMALSYVLLPSGHGEAAETAPISGVGNGAPTINTNGNVYNIYPNKVKGEVAVNTFNTFNLQNGKIANMYFKAQAGGDEANKLLNFVNEQININGTLNAIKSGKIGGDVYFLSPKGMVVGSTGVINAGSLTVMTPTEKWWDKHGKNATVDNLANEDINNITNMTVPINESGTIAVQGKINAVDSVRLKAAKVNVGMDANDSNYAKASIKTGIIEFEEFVNIEGVADAGLGKDLKAIQTGDGKILLAAENSFNDNKTAGTAKAEVNAIVNVAGGSEITAQDRKTAKTNNNVVEITAVASNNMGIKKYTKTEDGKNKTYYEVNGTDLTEKEFNEIYGDGSTNSLWHMDVTTNAKININNAGAEGDNKTTIIGERVDINAHASNKYASNENGLLSTESFTKISTSLLLNGWDVTVGLLENNAVVDIGANTIIKAEGQDTASKKALNINSTAESDMGLGTSIFGLDLLSGKWSAASLLPGVAVNYGVADNKAEIKIAGTLQAEIGNTNIYADADSKLHSTATTALPLSAAPVDGFVNLAFNYVKGTNISKVDITNTADLTKLGNDVDIKAYSNSDVMISTNIAMGDKGLACAGITFVDYTSDSSINVDTTINAKSLINLDSKSIYDQNDITTTASAGKGFLWGLISSTLEQSHAVNQTLDKIKFNLGDSIKQISNGTNLGNALEDIANMAKIGVAFNKVDEGNHAAVTLGANGKLLTSLADSNVVVNADSIVHKNHISTIGTSSNNKPTDGSQTAKLLANGAVQIVELNSSADIIVQGNAEDSLTSPKIKAKNVFLNTKSESPYDRIDTLMYNIHGHRENIESVITEASNPRAKKIYDDYNALLSELYTTKADGSLELKEEYKNDFSAFMKKLGQINQTEAAQRYADLLDGKAVTYKDSAGNDVTAQLTEEQSKQLETKEVGFFGKIAAAFAFLSPENYMTYHAGSSTSSQGNTPEDQQKASKLAAAVAFDYTAVNHKSDVLIGKDVVISAADKLGVNTGIDSGDVSMDGKLGTTGGGKVFSAGINVGIHNQNASNIIAVAENAKLNAANELKLGADNNVLHVGVNPGIGMSDNAQITGNLNFTYGNSDAVIFVDDEASLAAKQLSLNSVNDVTMVNIVGGLAMAGTASIGVAWSFNEINRNSLVVIGDNDAVAIMNEDKPKFPSERLDDEGKEAVHNGDDAETRAKKLLAYNFKDDKYNKANLFGSASRNITDAEISAHQMSVDAATDGTIDIITADVGVVLQGDSTDPGVGDKLNNFKSNLTNRIANKLRTFDDWIAGKAGQLPMNNWDALPVDQTAVSGSAGKVLPKFTLNASGSVGIAEMDSMTAAVVDNAKIKLVDDTAATTDAAKKNSLTVNAFDDSSLVNVSGGVGFELNNYSHQDEGFKSAAAMLTGGVAYNDVKSDVVAEIRKSDIDNADSITNAAVREGAITAAAAAINLQFSSGTQAPAGIGLAGGVSVNLGDYSTLAKLDNNNVNTNASALTGTNRTTELINNAATKDLQVTGALDLNVIKAEGHSIGIGAAVTRGYLQNTVLAELDKGEYRKLNNLVNNAVTDLTQVGAVIGGGVSIGQQEDQGTNVAVQGAMAFNDIENVVNANVKNAVIDAAGLDVRAYDTKLGSEVNKYAAKIADKYKLDTTGQKFVDAAMKDANNEEIGEHGSTIVGAALQFLGAEASDASSGIGIAGSVVNNYLDNNYGALVDGVTLNADANADVDTNVNVLAETSNLAVAAAAGVVVIEGSSAFAASGSVALNTVEGGATSKVDKSTLNTANVNVNALNKDKFVNVAGGVSLSSKSAGVNFAMNKMNTTTGAYLYDTSIKHASGANVAVNASDTARFVAVGAGIGAANISINGSLGINFGNNNVEAIVDGKKNKTVKSDLENIQSLTVSSTDDSSLVAVAGGFYIAGADSTKMFSGASLGGSFAWNEVGRDGSQTNKAELSNYNITTQAKPADTDEQGNAIDTTPTIEVKADDEASAVTVGAGVGIVAGKNAKGVIEGAGAYTKLHKDTEAAAKDISIDNVNGGASNFKVKAHEDNSITDVAAVVSAGKAWTVIGGAAAVADLNTATKAHVDNSNVKAKDIAVNSIGSNNVTSVSAGAAGSSSYLNAAGSVIVNNFKDDVKANVTGGTLEASENAAVTAEGVNNITNVAGALSVDLATTGVGVALGLSLIKNTFTGDVIAGVENANIIVRGITPEGAAAQTVGYYGYDLDDENKITRPSSKPSTKGLVVDAYSKQDLNNVAVTVGLSASGGDGIFTIAGTGAVALNTVGGSTEAYIKKSDINKNIDVPADVVVNAFNDADIDDNVVNAAVSVQGGSILNVAASVGAVVSQAALNRTVKANVIGHDYTGAAPANVVNADKLKVHAGALNDITSNSIGVSAAVAVSGGSGLASFSLAGGALMDDLSSTNVVEAGVKNVKSKNKGTSIKAAHDDDISYTGVGAMLSVAIPNESFIAAAGAVGVTDVDIVEDNTVKAYMENSVVDHDYTTSNNQAAYLYDDEILAANHSHHNADVVTVQVAGSLFGVAVGVTNINEDLTDTLKTEVKNSQILHAKNVNINSDNYYFIDSKSVGVSIALVGAGVGVSNRYSTLNSSSLINIDDSIISAKNVNINNEETRKVDMSNVNANIGAIAVGATRSYIGLGTVLQDVISTQYNGDASVLSDSEVNVGQDKATVRENKRKLLTGFKQNLKDSKMFNGEGDLGYTKETTKGTSEGVGTSITASEITAQDKLDVTSNIIDDVDVYNGSGTGGLLNVDVNVNRIDETVKNKLAVKNNSILTANEIDLLANVQGNTKARTFQGGIGAVDLRFAYSTVDVKGANQLELDDITVDANKASIKATDTATYFAKTSGFAGAIGGGGYIEAVNNNKVDNLLTITKADFEEKAKNSGVTIEASNNTKVEAETHFGAVEGIGGFTNSQVADLQSHNTLTITESTFEDKSDSKASGTAPSLNILSQYNASTDLKSIYGSGSIAGGGGTNAINTNKGSAALNVSGTTFDLDTISAKALVGKNDDTSASASMLAKSDITAINIAVGVGVGRNKSKVTLDTNSKADFSNNIFIGKEQRTLVGYDYEHGETPIYAIEEVGKTSLDVKALTNAESYNYITGVTVGLVTAVGNNETTNEITEITEVVFDQQAVKDSQGKAAATKLADLTLAATGNNKTTNIADGRGGGIFSISPYNAVVNNTNITRATDSVSGIIDVVKAANIGATQKDSIKFQATTASGGVLDVAGVQAHNTLKDNKQGESGKATGVSLNNAKLTAGTADINAHNVLMINEVDSYSTEGHGDIDDYAVKGGSGGIIAAVVPAVLENTIEKTAAVDMNNALISSAGDVNVNALSDNNIKVKASFHNAGVAAETEVKTTSNVTYNDKINLINSTVKTTANDGNVTLNAADESLVHVGSYAESIAGLITYANPETYNTLNRNNQINISGMAAGETHAVFSDKNVNIYAGDFASGRIGGIMGQVDAQSYSGGLIPPRKAKLENNFTQHNEVTIAKNTNIASTVDTNLLGNDGSVNFNTTKRYYCIYSSDTENSGYVSFSGDGGDLLGFKSYNRVNIDGNVTAGKNNKLLLNIGADSKELVILNKESREWANSQGVAASARPTISYGEDSIIIPEEDLKYYSSSIGMALYNRYKQLQAALSEYSNNETDPAYTQLLGALEATKNTMLSMGIARYERVKIGDTGNVYEDRLVVDNNIKTDVLELPNLHFSGGDININTHGLSSNQGTMVANGAPEVKITNNSSLYLKLNDVKVGEAGGKINFKTSISDEGVELAGTNADTINKDINTNRNIDKGVTAKFSKIVTSNGTVGKVDISSNYDGGTKTIPAKGDSAATITIKPYAAVELSKDKSIINKSGEVNLFAKNYDLLINGNVNGSSIKMQSETGSISQNSTAGIVNIGANPVDLYNSTVNTEISNAKLNEATSDKTVSTNNSTLVNSANSAGYISGGNIVISGEYININGLVQSGYAKYEVVIDADKQALIDKADKSSSQARVELVKGGMVYDSASDSYKYRLAAYYNPVTKQIEVPDVEAYAGNIFICGKILSTGNGRIKAVDGTYDIKITNNTTADLQLGNLVTTNMQGKITIVDSNKLSSNKVSQAVYTRADLNEGKVVINGTKVNADKDSNNNVVYKPVANQRYSWNKGTVTSTRKYKEKEYTTGGWFFEWSSDTDFRNIGTVTKTEKLDGKEKGQIGYVVADSSKDGSTTLDNFYFKGTNTIAGESVASKPIKSTWSSGLWGYYKHTKYEWYEDQGSNQNYYVSVAASKPITIGFLGNTGADSKVEVASKANINMQGQVGGVDSAHTTVDIRTSNGNIVQGSNYITASDVKLTAPGSMENIKIKSDADINLQIVNNAAADTQYYSKGKTTTSNGNAIDIKAYVNKTDSKGNIVLGDVTLQGVTGGVNGNNFVKSFDLKANANILQSDGADTNKGLISASKITLESTDGAIGTFSKYIKINSGENPLGVDSQSASINAKAKKDIYLEETVGDMRIGTIKSDADVYLRGEGSLVDALPYDTSASTGTSESELIKQWENLGLLSQRTSETTIKDENTKTTEITPFQVVDADGKAIKDADGKNLYYQFKFTTTANGHPVMDGDKQRVDDQGRPLYYEVKETKSTVWDANRLLYAISDQLMNPESGVDASTKAPNVKARNITLEMGDSTGLNSDTTYTFEIATLGADKEGVEGSGLDELKFLARQDASNVSWNKNNNGLVIVNQKLPIGIEMAEGGKLNIAAGNANTESNAVDGNVYVEGRTESKLAGVPMDINVQNVSTVGSNGLVLMKNAYGSIVGVDKSQAAVKTAHITANSLIVEAGGKDLMNGGVGIADNPLLIDLADDGTLRTTGRNGIYIKELNGDLNIENASSAGNIDIAAQGSLFSAAQQGYIRLETDGTELHLTSETGSIGTADRRINIRNSDFSATSKNYISAAEGDAYLYGNQYLSTVDAPSGVLYLNDVQVKDGGILDVISNGSIYAKTDDINADTLNLVAANDVTVVDSVNFKIDGAYISAGKLNDKIYGGNVNITAPSIVTGNSASTDKEHKIYSYVKDGVKGDISISATEAGITNAVALNAEGSVDMQAAANVENNSAIDAGVDVSIKAGTYIDNNGSIDAGRKVSLDAAAYIENSGAIDADGDVSIEAETYIENSGALDAGVDVSIEAGTYIENSGALDAGVDVSIKAGTYLDNDSAIDAGRKISIDAATYIENSGVINSGKNVHMGNTTITAGTYIKNTGAITAGNAFGPISGTRIANLVITAGKGEAAGSGTIENTAKLMANGNINITAYGENVSDQGGAVREAVYNTGELEAANDIHVVAVNGSIKNTAGMGSIKGAAEPATARIIELKAGKDIYNASGTANEKSIIAKTVSLSLTGDNGNIYNDMYLKTIMGPVTIEAGNNLTNLGTIRAESGEASFKAGNYIDNRGSLDAFNDAYFEAGSIIYNSNEMVSRDGSVKIVTLGNVATDGSTNLIVNHGNITAKKNVNIETKKTDAAAKYLVGDIYNSGNISAQTGFVKLSASQELQNIIEDISNENSGIYAQEYIELSAGSSITNTSSITAKGMDAKGDSVMITAGCDYMNLAEDSTSTLVGKITNTGVGVVNAAYDVTMLTYNGSINNAAKITSAHGNVEINALRSSSYSGTEAAVGNLYNLTEIDGAATPDITAGKSVILAATNTIKNVGEIIADNANVPAEDGAPNTIMLNSANAVNSGDMVITNAGNIIINVTEKLENSGSMNIGNETTREGGLVEVNAADIDNKQHAAIQIIGDGDIKVTASNDMLNAGDMGIWGKGDIFVSASRNIQNTGALGITGDGNVSLEAVGAVNNSGNMGVAGSGNVRLSSDSTMENTGVMLVSDNGNIDLHAFKTLSNSGSMSIGGKGNVAIEAGSLNNAASGEVTISQDGDINVKTTNNIFNDGDMNIGRNGNITLVSGLNMGAAGLEANGDTYNKGSMTIGNAANIGNGNITVTAAEDIRNSGNFIIHNEGNINMSCEEDLVNSGDMTVENKGNITLKTTENGTIYNLKDADMITGNGNVTLETAANYGIWYYDADKDNAITYVSDDPSLVNAIDAKLKAMKDAVADENGMMSVTLDGDSRVFYLDGLIFNSGDIMAMKGNISLASVDGDIYNFDDFNSLNRANGLAREYKGQIISTADINLTAPTGYIYNDKNIVSEQNVTIKAAEGLRNFAYNVYAVENITLEATDGDIENTAVLESIKGNVSLIAKKGNVINGESGAPTTGDIIALGGSVLLSANGRDADGNGYGVINYGDIVATGENPEHAAKSGTITLCSQYGDVYNYDNFNTVNTLKDTTVVESTKYNGQYNHNTEIIKPDGGSYNIAVGDINLSAEDGRIWNDKNKLVSLGSVTLKAKYGMDSFGENIYAGKDINLIATDGNLVNKAQLVSESGNISLEAARGTVVNMLSGDILALGGNVTMHAGQEAESNHQVYYVDTTNGKGTVIDLGLSDDNAARTLVVEKVTQVNGKEYIVSDVPTDHTKQVINAAQLDDKQRNAIQTKVYYIDEKGEKKYTGTTINHDAEVYRKGDVVNRGDITALGKTETQGDKQVITEPGTISLISDHSNVTNFDNFVLVDGAETYKLEGTKIFNEGTPLYNDKTYQLYVDKGELKATGNLALEAPEGYFYNDFNVVTNGDLIIKGKNDIVIGANFSADLVGGSLVVTSTEGKVISKGEELVAGKDVSLQGKTGVEVTDHIIAGRDVNAISDAGHVELQGDIDSVDGSTNVNAHTDATLNGNVNSGKDAAITAGENANIGGSITSGANTNIEAGKAATIDGDINSGAEVTVNAAKITANGLITAEEHILMDAADGDLLLMQDVTSNSNGIELYTKNGIANIKQNVTAYGEDALLRIYAELEEQKLSQGLVDAVIANGELTSLNGSIDIGAANGNAVLTKVKAEDMAAVGTAQGNVVLGNIEAGTVVLFNKDADNTVEAQQITVGKHLAVQSADPQLAHVNAADGVDQLTMDIVGVDDKVGGSVTIGSMNDTVDYAIGNLAVGTAKVYTGGNIQIGKVYVNGAETSEIVAGQSVAMDSISVANKLSTSGYGFDTAVYGSNLKPDDSKAVYYDNSLGKVSSGYFTKSLDELVFGKDDKKPVIADVQAALDNQTLAKKVTAGEARGMNLHIDGADHQSSDGILLHLDKYYYAGAQRYTLEDLSTKLAAYKADDSYSLYFSDEIGFFRRHNLYELPANEFVNGQLKNTMVEFEFANTADEDEKKAKKAAKAI